MAAKSLEEVGTTDRPQSRGIDAKDGLDCPASRKEGRKLQIFNLAACQWGLPRTGVAHNLMCSAT